MSQQKNIRNFIRGCHKCYPRDMAKYNIAIKTSMIFIMHIMNHEGFYRNYFEEKINVYSVCTKTENDIISPLLMYRNILRSAVYVLHIQIEGYLNVLKI